jgi:hypothetical protein
MAILQLVLIPYYRRATFGAGAWAGAFSYATAASLALRWIIHGNPAGSAWWEALTLTVATAVVVALGVATVSAIGRGQFFARRPQAPTKQTSLKQTSMRTRQRRKAPPKPHPARRRGPQYDDEDITRYGDPFD